MRKLTILAATVVALSFTAPSQARMPQSARQLRAARIDHRALPAKTQLRLADQTIRYAASTLRFLRQHPTAGTYRGRAVIAHNHAWLLRFGAAEHRAANARMAAAHAATLAVALPAHYRGWLCIHLGPSFNNTGYHEGTSTSGTYTGPLQMTNPWMGVYGAWGSMPETAVFAIAERVAARYGFAYSFMAGQWPQTFPGCAGYFR